MESLYNLLRRLLLLQVIIPIMLLFFGIMIYLAYQRIDIFVMNRTQLVQSTARMVDFYIEQSSKQLESIGNAAEYVEQAYLEIFVESTWEAYRYFDTIYYLNDSEKIVSMAPYDKRYIGMDMSSLPNYGEVTDNKVVLSKPFISLRTGQPTVYIRIKANNDFYVLGELRLSMLQEEINTQLEVDSELEEILFITDQYGTVLAHPDKAFVLQQNNMQYFGYENYMEAKDKKVLNRIDGILNLVLYAEVGKCGWFVVDSMPFLGAILPYISVIGVAAVIFMIVIFWALKRTKENFQENIEGPIWQLRKSTKALAEIDFKEGKALATIATAFLELNQLASDFEKMSDALHYSQSQLEQKVEERTIELTAINQQLIAMNDELNETLIKLKETQNQVIEMEKNTALNGLVAGVAHEINTPIGIAITASTYLESAYFEAAGLMKNGQMQKKDFLKLMGSCENSLSLIITNLNRAAKLISSFKLIAVNTNSDKIESFEIEDIWGKAIQILGHEYANKKIDFKLNTEVKKEMFSYPNAIFQILVHLIANSIEHGFDKIDQGEINLDVALKNKTLELIYRDNGLGMSKEVLNQMYEPFFTTGRGKGMTGLGMSIVYNTVIVKLKGSIHCESKLYGGTQFVIRIPID